MNGDDRVRILIIEDEPPIAEYIEEMSRNIIEAKPLSIHVVHSLESAREYLSKNQIDLCLLDLNLSGRNGYDILKKAVASSFHTIIVSAYTEQAYRAFEYGVLDFVPKPFNEERLRAALNRFFDSTRNKELNTKFLSARNGHNVFVVKIEDILYFKAADNYVEAYLKNGQHRLLDKTLYRLLQILPANFVQIHRSYIIDINQLKSYGHICDGKYEIELKNDERLPLSRGKYKEFRNILDPDE